MVTTTKLAYVTHSMYQNEYLYNEYLYYHVTDPEAIRNGPKEIPHLVRYHAKIPDWAGPGYRLKEQWHEVIGIDGRKMTCVDSELLKLDPVEQIRAARKFHEAQQKYKPPRQGWGWGEILGLAFLGSILLVGVGLGAILF